MKLFTKLTMGCLLAGALMVAAGGTDAGATSILTAKAVISGAPGSGISGEALFFQVNSSFPVVNVLVVARVSGLAPNSVHGFHIHEIGACVAPGFTSAGGHFDPGPNGNSQPDNNHPYHMGDVPNMVADDDGVGTLTHITSRVSLSPGQLTVFDADGTGVIVHANPDLGTTGVPGGSGGPRIACGVVQSTN